MDSPRRYDIASLRQLCQEKTSESLRLEFKPCNELKVGTEFHDRKRNELRGRQTDDVLIELTRDVTAFLNAAGGTLIYGILEDGNSRARKLDGENAFRSDSKQDNVRPEKVVDWLRYHIQPSPAVDVYRVSESDDEGSRWYLVVEVPQGHQAFQAKDHRFYKRVGNTVRPMEQYEVADVMSRTRAASLDLRVNCRRRSHPDRSWILLSLGIAVTSTNFVASEYGALKLTLAYPLRLSGSLAKSMRFGQ